MKTSLTKIVEQKSQLNNELEKLKNNYITTIYSELSKGKPIKDIHKKLIEETIQAKKKGLATSDTMLKQAKNNANALKKRIGNKSFNAGYVKISYGDNIPESEILSILVFDLINKAKVEKRLSHEITLEADKQESKSKEETFKNSYENNRKKA